MITKDNIKALLNYFKFTENGDLYKKDYPSGATIEVDFNKRKITYNPLDGDFKEGEFPTKEKQSKGFVVHRDTTLNFNANENFVCLVCVHLLLEKGYEPKHIVFEPAFKVGHINKPSYGDILVFDKEYNPLVLIENKTFDKEFSKEWNNMQKDGGQLFSYLGPLVNELGLCENLVLFAADFEEKPILKNHIITLKDNEKRLTELDNPKSFANAQGKYFEVWSETYGKSFETKGLFENDIEAYSIGKLKYTIDDLKELSHAEIRPIYHEFATILRNHAITDFEHSFYILIDLFLCKITDERKNPHDLQFYYKGITRDTPKEYCSRLLKLYQEGKSDLFHVEVVNKDESDIKQIFEYTNRSVTNGLYAGIKELFEEIKFYNIKKFNFIDVENKEDFEKNFQILIKIAALIQDINLSNSETNHFFGDLFEGLLSKNVHQTEGQFFTPLPIVNFIINSLPEFPNSNNIKVLDYACGAGHFLTEFVKKYPDAKAYGIEKSQTLSQVAKIATIINGSKDAHIVFKDSLSCINTNEVRYQGFDKDSFDCIIANPPYSVKGFLNTITQKDRKQFALVKYVEEKALDTNNSIECFFIERTKHFLRPNGLVGIVLPSSILSNGNLYIKTRELLFANFDILAVVNLNSRTFGSTGTNTIVLFAQRVKKNSEGLLHTFIDKKDYTQYLSWESVDNYIKKQGYDDLAYRAFMQEDELYEDLEKHEVFAEYRRSFKPTPIKKTLQMEWFENSSYFNADTVLTAKERKEKFSDFCTSNEYKKLVEEEYRRQFIAFAKEIESDKLNTYIQVADNNVAILQSPPDKIGNKSNKAQIVKFLGYDWSNRKGDEGIKYVTNKTTNEIDEDKADKNDKDAEVVEAINSIKYIDTTLYSPDDCNDSTKFAYAIRKHIYEHCRKFSFGENNVTLHEDFSGEMSELLSHARLSDMIDFSRTEFDKTVKLTADKKIEIQSKFPLVKLGGEDGVCNILIGGTPSRKNAAYFTGNHLWVSIAEMRGQVITDTKEKITDEGVKNSNVKLIPKGTTLLSFKLSIGKTAIAGADLYTNEAIAALIPKDKKTIADKYLFSLFNGKMIDLENVGNKAFGKSLNSVYLNNEVKIPLPPLDIQNQIVSECEKVDEEYNNSRMTVEEYKRKRIEVLNSTKGENKALKTICDMKAGKFVSAKDIYDEKQEGMYPCYGGNGLRGYTKDFTHDGTFPLIGRQGALCGNVCMAFGKFHATEHAVAVTPFDEIDVFWLRYELEHLNLNQYATGAAQPGLSVNKILEINCLVPPLAEQRRIVSEIEAYEAKISKAKSVMQGCAERKKKILEKWLK
ncbi:MAG: methyltransferase domain-containing protein [Bacteroidales bacterium]|jgi:type I restriction-modification system DNA methylase subunit/restriction endonuclease S subunit|nr:methyltransferase domain-containing protein [Bacteroidales bacterium]